MKSKVFWGAMSAIAASLPLAAAAEPSLDPYLMVDYHEQSLAEEVIYGTVYDGDRLRVVTDPTGAALRRSFEFPIDLSVKRDSSITTKTVITDRYSIHQFGDCNGDNRITLDDVEINRGICNSRFSAWADEVRECMASKPVLIRDLTGNEAYINGEPGVLALNASGTAVCAQFVGRATPVSMGRQCTDVTVESRPFIAPSPSPMQQEFVAPVRGLW
jgi:hypothetical protein